MSTDCYIGSNDCVPETWVPHSNECLLETWAPELQSHGGLGGSAWLLFPDRIRSASSEQDVLPQTTCRPIPSHASRGKLGGDLTSNHNGELAVSYGRSSDGHLPPTSFGREGNNFGGEGNSDFGGERNNNFGNWQGGAQLADSFPADCGTARGYSSNNRRILGQPPTEMLPARSQILAAAKDDGL